MAILPAKRPVNLSITRSSIVDAGNASGLAIKQSQEIGDDFLEDCAAARALNGKTGDKNGACEIKVADIPVVLVNKWMREGFNIFEQKGPEGLQAILDRLDAEDKQVFKCTNMRFK